MNNMKGSNLCSAVLGLSLVCVAYAQAPVIVPMVSSETYQRVLEIIFPRNSLDFSDPTKEFALTLRFSPVSEAGSQINITKHSDGRLEVVTYTLPNRSQSISEQLNGILRQTGRENAEEMARHLNVQRQVVNDTRRIRRIRQLLERFAALCVPVQLDTSITLDGTYFQLWYEAASNKSYYSLVGGEPGHDRADHPLVRWMNEVRQATLR